MTCLDDRRLREILSRGLAAVPGAMEHLADCHSCGARLKELSTMEHEDNGPQLLGRYVILSPFGEGRYGKVYEAHDPDLDRTVALKVISTADHFRSVETIAREAQAMARVKNPHVVQIHDAQIIDGDVILTMEAIDGVSLDQWLTREKPTRARTLGICHQVAMGLSATHTAGILHRDIKPQNILVNSNHRAYLADFGLATKLGAAEAAGSDHGEHLELTTSTRTATFAGTPAYMAPELFDGEAASTKSDVYALATMIHEVLLGGRPFEGCKTVSELREAQKRGVSVRSIKRAGLPKSIAEALSRSLQPDPDARTYSATDLAGILSPTFGRRRKIGIAVAATVILLSVTGISLGKIWSRQDAVDKRRAHYESCVLNIGKITDFTDKAALDGVGGKIPRNTPAGHVWSAARSKLEELGRQIDTHGRSSCTTTFMDGTQSQTAHRRTTECFEAVAADANELIGQLERDGGKGSYPILMDISRWSIQPCLDGTFSKRTQGATWAQLNTMRRLERILGQLSYALEQGDSGVVDTLRARFDTLASNLKGSRAREYRFKLESRILASEHQWKKVEELSQTELDAGVDETSHIAAEAWVRLIEALVKQDRFDEARVAKTAAARSIQRAANEPTIRSRYLYYDARLDYLQGKFEKAKATLTELVSLREKLDHDLALAHALKTLAVVNLNLGEHGAAEAHLQRAERLVQAWEGSSSKASLEIRAAMAELALKKGETERATRITSEIIARAQGSPTLREWFFVNEYLRLARIETSKGDTQKAREALLTAQKAAAQRNLSTDKLLIDAAWASLLIASDQHQAAWDRCDEMRLPQKTVRSEDALVLLPALASCASSASERQTQQAIAFYQRGIEISSLAGASRWSSWFHMALGLHQAKVKSYSDAAKNLRTGLDGDQQRIPPHLRAQALYSLAACRANLGEIKSARELCSRAIVLSADSEKCNHPTCRAVLKGAEELQAQLSKIP